MTTIKKIKKEIIEIASKNPEKFYPIKTLKNFGLKRFKCQKTGTYFWSKNERKYCGEPECVGGYTFINNTPAKTSMEFVDVYDSFSKFLSKNGYTPIERFPVVARWRDDLDFNIASIVGFQPYVVRGEVEPPANPLTIPQICLRFSDIDNIGFTGRHHTGFTMIGQHAFENPKNYDIEKYFKLWFSWFLEELKIPIEEITIHEDAWAGGGNCGASLEIFSGGLELGNQVYMTYDMSEASSFSEVKELSIKVLDMGMGQERCCWFSKGSINSYEACMPMVCQYLFKQTKIKPNYEIYSQFAPFSGNLNIDEVEDISIAWKEISDKLNVDVDVLRTEIEPLAGIYSIADHARTLLYALSDGALPSNVKGGYNLRLLIRRSLDFIIKFNWDISLFEVIKLHADELQKQYPELSENLESIETILKIETEKFFHHKEKMTNKIEQIIKKNHLLSTEEFIKLYISDGISPEDIKQEYIKKGLKIQIPYNFYSLVSEFFEKDLQNQETQKNIFEEYIKDIQPTKMLYYESLNKESEEVTIIKKFEIDNKKYIILDKTLFYPTGGGQLHDVGMIENYKVVNVFKVKNIIIHQVA